MTEKSCQKGKTQPLDGQSELVSPLQGDRFYSAKRSINYGENAVNIEHLYECYRLLYIALDGECSDSLASLQGESGTL